MGPNLREEKLYIMRPFFRAVCPMVGLLRLIGDSIDPGLALLQYTEGNDLGRE